MTERLGQHLTAGEISTLTNSLTAFHANLGQRMRETHRLVGHLDRRSGESRVSHKNRLRAATEQDRQLSYERGRLRQARDAVRTVLDAIARDATPIPGPNSSQTGFASPHAVNGAGS
jgi:hypothetical protein